MSASDFESFRQWVLENPEVQRQLREISDAEEFMTALPRIASQHGYCIAREEAEAAMRAGQIAWLQRNMWW